ncbi:hypothetical protein GOBAR_AA33906 [Gossypium barbadense]|uniref:Uncharacterized protein n=1 Tax=Gossypium barbadense TaxID=3634 RepID=A0A2P5W6T6_GOSBA|nr:hypothetical protein GOBAR_AA33906 [Gossypium barbadense]
MVSKGKSEVSHNKMVNEEYRPRVPYPNEIRKDYSDEQFGEVTLRVGDKTITLQACTSGITSSSEGNGPHQSTKTDNMTQPILQKLSFKEVDKPCSSNDRGHTHEERRLRIEELDEWLAHKLTTHDKSKLRQNEPDTSPNQLKVGDKVLLDATDPHIVTTTLNKEIPLTVLSIFPFGTVEVSHPRFGTFKHTRPGTRACLKPWPIRGRDTAVQYGRVDAGHDFPKTWDAINPHGRATWLWVNLIGEHGHGNGKTRVCQRQGLILFLRHGSTLCHHREARRPRSHPQKDIRDRVLPRYVLQPKFGTLSLIFRKLCRRSYFRYYAGEPSLQVVMTNNNDPNRSKASALAPSLRYLHTILAQTLTGRRESTDVVNNHDTYYLWCMVNAHVTDLAYFIAFAIRHQIKQHQKGVISIGPYVTCLARHFGLLNTVAQSSALTLIGQMSPQGITTMLHMRMIERQRGTDPR